MLEYVPTPAVTFNWERGFVGLLEGPSYPTEKIQQKIVAVFSFPITYINKDNLSSLLGETSHSIDLLRSWQNTQV